MCDFGISLMVASLAVAAASAVASDQSARDQTKSQKAYQEAQQRAHNKAATQNAENAIKEQVEQTAAENIQQMQNQDAAARELQANQRDYLHKKGAALASSPHLAGNAMDALMADYERAYAINRDVVQEQLAMHGVAARTNIEGYRDKAVSRINAQQGYIPAPITQPNAWASALGFAGNALGSYNAATNYGRTPLSRRNTNKT